MTGASRPNGRTCREFFGSERRVGPEALRVAFLSVPEVLVNIKNYLDDALGRCLTHSATAAGGCSASLLSVALQVPRRFRSDTWRVPDRASALSADAF